MRTQMKNIANKEDGVDVDSDSDVYHLLRTAKPRSLILCHNHPGLTDFLANDINVFMRYVTIKVMTIVTNQGGVKYILKNGKFNYKETIELMKKCKAENNDDRGKSIEQFLKECHLVGIEAK